MTDITDEFMAAIERGSKKGVQIFPSINSIIDADEINNAMCDKEIKMQHMLKPVKIRKKPVEIEAIRFTGDNINECLEFAHGHAIQSAGKILIHSKE